MTFKISTSPYHKQQRLVPTSVYFVVLQNKTESALITEF